jgi:hypothetical protein
MPASTVALTVLDVQSTPAGAAANQQASTVTPGNNFLNDGWTLVDVVNTTGGALTITFEADVFGAERTVLSTSIAAGARVPFGPFAPGKFNGHDATEAASNGRVFMRQIGGSNGGLTFSPYKVSRNLFRD